MTTTSVSKKEPAAPPADIERWEPWTGIDVLRTMLGTRLPGLHHQAVPATALEERDDAYLLELEVPGLAKKDIGIDVTGRRITVHGEREETERTGILRHTTRTTGRFDYELMLPSPVDEKAVTARLDHGVLVVRVPKAGDSRTTHVEIM